MAKQIEKQKGLSAKRRNRLSETRRERNKAYKSRMRNVIRQLRETTEKTAATELLAKAGSILDRLVGKGIIHKNTAANKKSRLAKFVNQLG